MTERILHRDRWSSGKPTVGLVPLRLAVSCRFSSTVNVTLAARSASAYLVPCWRTPSVLFIGVYPTTSIGSVVNRSSKLVRVASFKATKEFKSYTPQLFNRNHHHHHHHQREKHYWSNSRHGLLVFITPSGVGVKILNDEM